MKAGKKMNMFVLTVLPGGILIELVTSDIYVWVQSQKIEKISSKENIPAKNSRSYFEKSGS